MSWGVAVFLQPRTGQGLLCTHGVAEPPVLIHQTHNEVTNCCPRDMLKGQLLQPRSRKVSKACVLEGGRPTPHPQSLSNAEDFADQ